MHDIHTRTSRMPAARRVFLLASLAAIACTAGASEIATDPGDYAALPPGLNLGIIYYQHTERNAYYANGTRLPGPFKLVTDIGLARFVHFMKVGDYVVDPQIIIPFGRVDLRTAFGPLTPVSASGVGDPLVGGTLWLLNRQEQKQWWGVSAFAAVPAGQYEASRGPVNVGENRWKGIFQTAYVTALGKNFMLDAIAEYTTYGENDNFLGLEKQQAASYGIQSHLRYVVSPSTSVALSYYHDFGGATRLNGAAQNDRMNNGRWQVGIASFVTPTLQLQLQAGKASTVHNGARESSRVNLRLVKVL
jgi:hypothetical protein